MTGSWLQYRQARILREAETTLKNLSEKEKKKLFGLLNEELEEDE